jgi:pyruvate dehydrogenase E2 component (dihydrolipoamide acetyltransferase)
MTTPMKLPQFGMGMNEAQIVAWLKAAGDRVEKGEPLLEVEAAKTNVEVVAPVSGVLQQILAQVGETVPVYHVVALIETADGAASTTSDMSQTAPGAHSPSPARTAEASMAPARISPHARRLAAQQTVNAVAGSNPPVEFDRVALSNRRRLSARRMLESLQRSAQLTLTCGVDVTELVELRARLVDAYPLTLTDLFIRAAALALRRHPDVNAVLEDEALHRLARIDIGIAVALEDGLVVPVLRRAAELSLRDVAAERARLAAAARAGTLTPAELSGSTFTVTNLGAHGIDGFTPILNRPEIAILGVGAVHERYRRGEGASGRWRHWTTLSLTIDHQAIDGVPGALFLKTVSELCASPRALL